MKRFAWIAVMVLCIGVLPVAAWLQQACPPLVTNALRDVGEVCGSLDRNSICYGFKRVEATFDTDVADEFFSKPADRADLVALRNVSTAGLDESLQTWGVAVMSAQANVPNSLPGQAVRFILFGDTTIENQVDVKAARLPTTPIDVSSLANANIRSSPSSKANVVAGASKGSILAAEGISADGEWVQVVNSDNSMGWISRQLVNPASDLSQLPVINKDSRSPMQAFLFRTGIGKISCDAAPSLLVVQGPQNVNVQITANGLDIGIGSTIVLRSIDGGKRIELITLHGTAHAGLLAVQTGYSAYGDVDTNGRVAFLYGWHPLKVSELQDLQWLEQIPANLLEYPIDVPSSPVYVPAAPPTSTNNGVQVTPVAGLPVDCSDFRAVSPLSSVASRGTERFEWRPATGSTLFKFHIQGYHDRDTAALDAFVDLSKYSGATLTWWVEAWYFDQLACSTPPITVSLPPSTAPAMSASWACAGIGNLRIAYSNLPSGTTSVQYNFHGATTPATGYTQAAPPASGSMVFGDAFGPIDTGSVLALPSGQTVSLPGALDCSLG